MAIDEADDEGSMPGLTGDSWPVCSTDMAVVWVVHVDIGEGERWTFLAGPSSEGVRWASGQRGLRLEEMGMGTGIGRAIVGSLIPELRDRRGGGVTGGGGSDGRKIPGGPRRRNPV
ncbi:hypothetical protein IMZ48_45630 [Candidatus Bathyarchaeota archaeon]|nr:hypothetical protein [Candidatus Bathyarchaeota archaeon]